jgi:hypothetical protein
MPSKMDSTITSAVQEALPRCVTIGARNELTICRGTFSGEEFITVVQIFRSKKNDQPYLTDMMTFSLDKAHAIAQALLSLVSPVADDPSNEETGDPE